MKQAIIVDIDFTLLDSSIPIALKDKAEVMGKSFDEYWAEFYNNLDMCVRNEWCYVLIDNMTRDDVTVLFLTGRDERCRKDTLKFLKFSHPVKFELYMRKHNDLRGDVEVKTEMLNEVISRYNILFAIDDREDNCQLYKSYGIPALKVV